MSQKRRQVAAMEVPGAGGGPRGPLAAALAGVWFAALTVGMVAAIFFAWRHTSYVEEFPQACDSFGYLQAAEDIRVGHAPRGLPRFTAGSAGIDALVTYLKSAHVAPAEWEGLLGPQAYNYCAASGRIINQYPPGVPLLLALFPPGRALASLYTIALAALAAAGAGGIAGLAWQYRRTRSVLSLGAAGVWAAGVQLALMLLGTTVSYSVDFLSVPMLAALGLLYLAHGRRGGWMVLLVALAGASAGYAVLMRMTVVLFVPGMVVIVWAGAEALAARLSRVGAFLGAMLCAGVLPLLLHQRALTGSLFISTYGRRDATAPTLDVLGANFAHYFTGDGSLGNWALLVSALAALAGAVLAGRSRTESRGLFAWLIGAAVLFVVPTLFYLTHTTTTPYYQLPTVLVTVLAVALGLAVGGRQHVPSAAQLPRGAALLLLLALLTPGTAHIVIACIPPTLQHVDNAPAHNLVLPQVVLQPDVWIYGERFTGTLWYFHGIHAQNLLQGTPQTRYLLYRFAFDRGEKQYLIYDVDTLRPVVDEAAHAGATFPQVGTCDGRPVVEIVWPPGGPIPPRPPESVH
jgi:hypothetical protein